ncbi:type VI secretion system lipoprotein TssJ [Enterobacter ludwigii]|nr:type VI secretion system lipoprotein TssJ [Enterobacter ludwigii]
MTEVRHESLLMKKNYCDKSFLFIILAFLTFLASCSSFEKPDSPATISITLVAEQDINPDESGTANPVRVTLYQLSQSEEFMMSDFMTLQHGTDSEVMLKAKKDITYIMVPGESKDFALKLDRDTQSIGVITGYRSIERAQWKTIYQLPEQEKEHRFGNIWSVQQSWPPKIIVHMKNLTTSITQVD